MAEIFFPVRDYALAETLQSGQAFRWREVDGGWESVVKGRWVRLLEKPNGIAAKVVGVESDWSWLSCYLQLGIDIEQVIASFPKDPHLQAAIESCRGLRLLRQDPWECLASFILSSTKQIVQIQQIVDLVCRRFGDSVAVPEGHLPAFSFPSAQIIAGLSESDLRECKMGFRAPYIAGSAKMVASGEIDLAAISGLPLEKAREELMRLPGVGRKIADCVLLFAYGFQRAFPVDVWILKALLQLYFPRRKKSPKKLLEFTQTYFGPNAGFAQQFLFHYMRTRFPKS